ncbi:unnamed protein product [Arabidopsis thaliana]|uniref:(thale cress) hypothetical protein n=1 Tax=Arabidopsis thaliana TaxID=3702 RepID=A0A7G2E8P2_ARATH|nr:unnamed protein product [Arabidopsis thaliana]
MHGLGQQQREPLHVNAPFSDGNILGVQGSSHPPSPPTPTTQPSVNHSAPPPKELNNLTLEELLDSLGRAGLTRLDPNCPPITFWFDQDPAVAATVRSIFDKTRARKHCEKTGETTPHFLVLLDETHRKADGTVIDGKSEEIYKKVTSRIEEEESHMC